MDFMTAQRHIHFLNEQPPNMNDRGTRHGFTNQGSQCFLRHYVGLAEILHLQFQFCHLSGRNFCRDCSWRHSQLNATPMWVPALPYDMPGENQATTTQRWSRLLFDHVFQTCHSWQLMDRQHTSAGFFSCQAQGSSSSLQCSAQT